MDLPHRRDRARNRRCPGQRPTHEICDTLRTSTSGHLELHGGKDLFEAGFGGQLVPMLDDLVTKLPVAGVGLVEYAGRGPAVSIRPPAKKRRRKVATSSSNHSGQAASVLWKSNVIA